MASCLYVGLMSGTSVDGIDAVLVEIGADAFEIVAAETYPLPDRLAERITALIAGPTVSLSEYGAVDAALGEAFADSALAIIAAAGKSPADVRAIGHHGQTVHHQPTGAAPFTLQIGDPNRVMARTGIATVADFRRLDIAYGGQGAPLVSGFHEFAFRDPGQARITVNIGGIANVTVLMPGTPAIGFDTGPGNTLLDHWMTQQRGAAFDADGRWAAGGRVDSRLLERLLADPYFERPPPKSTGREWFNGDWLSARLRAHGPIDPRDVQATLAELTAATIVGACAAFDAGATLVVCGGGAHNTDLLARLRQRAGGRVVTSDELGIAPDWVEGAAFAWLARARLEAIPGNVPSVTGARQAVVLGGVYCGLRRETSPQRRSTRRE